MAQITYDIVEGDQPGLTPSELEPLPSQVCFRARALESGRVVGEVLACSKAPYKPTWGVQSAKVVKAHRRRHIATRLYALAAREVCRRGAALESSYARAPETDAFWRKQLRKGRATHHREQAPWGKEIDFYRLRCPAPSSLDRRRR